MEHDSELARDRILGGALVVALVAEAEPERGQPSPPDLPGRDRSDRRRVETAAEIGADLDVRTQPDADRIGEQLLDLVDELVLVRFDGREVDVPPARLRPGAVRPEHDVVRRRQLTDPDERRAVRQGRPRDERVGDPDRVELARRCGVAEQRLGLGREADVAVVLREEERTHAEAVARQQRLARLPVPDRDREVSVEALEAADAPLRVGLRDHLGVGGGREPASEPFQLGAQFDVVVDLAVLHHPVARALVAQRLVAALEVDDREARVGHAEAPVEVDAHAVRPPVPQLPCHGQQKAAVSGAVATPVDPGDPAHAQIQYAEDCGYSTPSKEQGSAVRKSLS